MTFCTHTVSTDLNVIGYPSAGCGCRGACECSQGIVAQMSHILLPGLSDALILVYWTGAVVRWCFYVRDVYWMWAWCLRVILVCLATGWPCLTQMLQSGGEQTRWRPDCSCAALVLPLRSVGQCFNTVWSHDRRLGLMLWWLTPLSIWWDSAVCWLFICTLTNLPLCVSQTFAYINAVTMLQFLISVWQHQCFYFMIYIPSLINC